MPEAHAGMMVTSSVKLVRPLGGGGMGAVWVADHLALHTQVVVKFIASELKGSKDAVERFSREAAAAAQVKSPHVVQTFDHGVTADGTPYIVMELLEGRDLGRRIDEERRLAPEVVIEISSQLARALDRAHERGIVHRDIKPGNIFLCDGGNGDVFVKLLDFGIAKGVEIPHLDSETKTGSMIGSPFYMSPEQILGSKSVDRRSDLWSVGVVVYEMLTGTKPFDAETMGGLAIRIHSEPLPLPSRQVSTLSPAVDAWFARACARNQEERFDSCREMADTLVAALGGTAPPSRDMVKSGPRSSGGISVDAPTLAVGATTEAGVVSAPRPRKGAGRAVAVVVFGACLASAAFFGVKAIRKDAGSPVTAVSPVEKSAPPPSVAPVIASVIVAPVETVPTPALSASQAPSPAAPARTERQRRPVGAIKTAAPAASSPSTAPSPPAPAPAPAPTGHDIF